MRVMYESSEKKEKIIIGYIRSWHADGPKAGLLSRETEIKERYANRYDEYV